MRTLILVRRLGFSVTGHTTTVFPFWGLQWDKPAIVMKRGVSADKKSDFAAEKRHRESANVHRGGKNRGSDLFGFVGTQSSPGCLL